MQIQSFGFSVFEIADYFLSMVNEEIPHLKLQKFVYYSQCASIGIYSRPLFYEKIHAGLHGPFCPVLYKAYVENDYGRNQLSDFQKTKYKIQEKAAEAISILNDVFKTFSSYSSSELEFMTHQDKPWLEAISHGVNTVITHQKIYGYFKRFNE